MGLRGPVASLSGYTFRGPEPRVVDVELTPLFILPFGLQTGVSDVKLALCSGVMDTYHYRSKGRHDGDEHHGQQLQRIPQNFPFAIVTG